MNEMKDKKCSDLSSVLKYKFPNIPSSVSSNSELKDKKINIDAYIKSLLKDCKIIEQEMNGQEMNGGRRMRKQKTNGGKTNKRKTNKRKTK